MKITHTAVNAIKDALEGTYDYFRVCDNNKSVFDSKLILGINWSAIGTVSPEDAREFGQHIADVAYVLEKINALNLTVTYDEDANIQSESDYEAQVTALAWCMEHRCWNQFTMYVENLSYGEEVTA